MGSAVAAWRSLGVGTFTDACILLRRPLGDMQIWFANLVCKTRSYSYHGAHPFTVLYWPAHALDHLGDVIVVSVDPGPQAARASSADSVAKALEMAQDTVGRVRARPTCAFHRSLCAR
jgi:hypothetical protein